MPPKKINHIIYEYYPRGVIPADDYYLSNEIQKLSEKVSNSDIASWNLFVNDLNASLKTNLDNRGLIFHLNPCFSFFYHTSGPDSQISTLVFHLSLISEYYCFYIKSSYSSNMIKQMISTKMFSGKHMREAEREKLIKEQILKVDIKLFEGKIIWNDVPEFLKDKIHIINEIIGKHYPCYNNISNAYLFDIIPDVATISKPALNTANVFDCLFIDYLIF